MRTVLIPGWGEGQIAKRHAGTFWGDGNLYHDFGCGLHGCMHLLRPIKLYT